MSQHDTSRSIIRDSLSTVHLIAAALTAELAAVAVSAKSWTSTAL